MPLVRLLRFFCLTAFILFAYQASAAAPEVAPKPTIVEWQEKKFELQLFSALGGPIGLTNDAPYDESTPKLTWILGTRAGLPRWTDLQLELNMVIPHGFGVNIVWNVFHSKYFRLHLLDPGVFANVWSPASTQNFPREVDMTMGAGLDLRIWETITITTGVRWFFPNPFDYMGKYGHFIIPVYREALQGGQIWFGLSWRFGSL